MRQGALLFAGTREGRELATALAARGVPLTVCVATEYGRLVLAGLPDVVEVRAGRLDVQGMQRLMQTKYTCAIDATHPYAQEATANIRAAGTCANIPVYRLLREQEADDAGITVPHANEAARELRALEGNVLLTIGSKDLACFTSVSDYNKRLFPRILPTVENLQNCLDLGFASRNILAIQGPFSRAWNEAMIRQFSITCLVTKNSGSVGGYSEKVEAARATGATIITISRPREDGCTFGSVRELLDYLEVNGCT